MKKNLFTKISLFLFIFLFALFWSCNEEESISFESNSQIQQAKEWFTNNRPIQLEENPFYKGAIDWNNAKIQNINTIIIPINTIEKSNNETNYLSSEFLKKGIQLYSFTFLSLEKIIDSNS